jgi:hypothetical protein
VGDAAESVQNRSFVMIDYPDTCPISKKKEQRQVYRNAARPNLRARFPRGDIIMLVTFTYPRLSS